MGHVFIFDIHTGCLISAINSHPGKKIFKIMFVDELNSFITLSEEECKFWRIGEINDRLTGELKKKVIRKFSH